MKRWDLTERGALEPMEETHNGDWALYDEAEAEVAARAQTIKQLAQELGISEGALASATQENERLRKALSGRLQENERLREEIEVLRLYGNKDCTHMADAELARRRAVPQSPVT